MRIPIRLLLCLCTLLSVMPCSGRETDFTAARLALVDELRTERQQLSPELGSGGFGPRVLVALAQVPRHEFVPDRLRTVAYENRPLPIGYGQTISQPFIVALMTDLLQLEPGHRVLEIGTGSGYQAAVLAEITPEVYSIEIVPGLAEESAARLKRLGYTRVATRLGDGYQGWPERAPFDAIIVTAAPTRVPPPLLSQLKPGGRLVIPVGSPFLTQYLLLITKRPDGTLSTREILPVAFVPLTGGR
jgi:protein-L-isoaspartate(D-aspartate) O-methyltransferase